MERKESIIITGSNGLIGTALAKRLNERFHVVGFDIKPPRGDSPLEEFVEVDLTSDESVQEGLQGVRDSYGDHVASVVHLAAYYDFSGEDNPLYQKLTVDGTSRLLKQLQSLNVQQFIFSSTMLVHAPCKPGQHIDEGWPLDPRWPYPQSKVDAEEVIRAQHGEIQVAILRIAGVYTDMCDAPIIAEQIRRIYERQLISRVFPGDTSHGQSYVHLDDVVNAMVKAIERRKMLPSEAVFLIGEPDPMSYDEMQREIGKRIHDEGWQTQQIPKSVAKAGAWVLDTTPIGEEPFIKPWMIDFADDHYALDITGARTELGWEPRHSLRQTLPRMIEALKRDPVGWYRENKLEPPSELEERQANSA